MPPEAPVSPGLFRVRRRRLTAQAIILVLISAVVHVGWNALLKSSRDPGAFALLKGTVILLASIAAAPFIPFDRIPDTVWPFVIGSGFIHTAYIISLSGAYTHGDISFVYPIVRSSPALVPVAAWFLIDERLSSQGIAGIAVVVLCILALQKRPLDAHGTHPGRWLRVDLLWALACLSTVVGYTVVDKAGMTHFSGAVGVDPFWRGPIYFVIEHGICYALFWGWTVLRGDRTGLGAVLRTEWLRILPASVGLILSYSLILHVLQTEEASYVVTLRQSSVLIAVLAGVFLFREKQAAYRIAVAVVMLIGFYLVATA